MVRNKLKRRMRAVIGAVIGDVLPCQAVFAVKSQAGEMTFAQIEKELNLLLQKSGLLKRHDGEKEI